jgi:hypothetical protein
MSFDWTNPKDLDSLINTDRIADMVANPDNPGNAEALRIINKMPLPTEVIITDEFVDEDNE